MLLQGPKNVAMLYVVGPKGTGATAGHGPSIDSLNAFHQAVEAMAENALCTVADYNALEEGLERIETVQFCCLACVKSSKSPLKVAKTD